VFIGCVVVTSLDVFWLQKLLFSSSFQLRNFSG
jgi:hypothetical protein